MKKITAIILAAVLALSLCLCFTACKNGDNEKDDKNDERALTPYEKVQSAWTQVGNLLGISSQSGTDINDIGIAVNIEKLQYEGEDILPGNTGINAEFIGDLSKLSGTADITAFVGEEKLSATAELLEKSLYLSVPHASEKFLYFKDLLETDGSGQTEAENFAESVKNWANGIITEDSIVKTTESIEVFKTAYENAEKLTVNITAEQFAALIELFPEALPEQIGYDKSESGVTATLSYYFASNELIRMACDVELRGFRIDGENAEDPKASFVLDLKHTSEEQKCALSVKLLEGDGTEFLSVTFDSSVENGNLTSSAKLTVNDGEDKTVIGFTASGKFDEEKTEISGNGTLERQGVTLTVPFTLTSQFADEQHTTTLFVDTTVAGVTVKADVSVIKKHSVYNPGKYDMANAVQVDINSETQSEEISQFTNDIIAYLEKNCPNITNAISSIMFALQQQKDVGDDDTICYSLLSDDGTVAYDFYGDGTAFQYVSCTAEIEGDSFIVYTNEAVQITLDGNFIASVKAGGVTKEYACETQQLSEEEVTVFTVWTDDECGAGFNEVYQIAVYTDGTVECYVCDTLFYVIEGNTVKVELLNGNLFMFDIPAEDGGTVTVNGAKYSFFAY